MPQVRFSQFLPPLKQKIERQRHNNKARVLFAYTLKEEQTSVKADKDPIL